MEYEQCVNNNANILMEKLNTTDVTYLDPKTILQSDGTNLTIPELEKCDLQETLRNVSSFLLIPSVREDRIPVDLFTC